MLNLSTETLCIVTLQFPSGYNAIFETNLGELLVVYDHTEDRVSDGFAEDDRRLIYADRYRIVEE